MCLPTILELKESIDFEINYVLGVLYKDDIIHLVCYEENPNEESLKELWKEIRTDEELGLTEYPLWALTLSVLTIEQYSEVLEFIAEDTRIVELNNKRNL